MGSDNGVRWRASDSAGSALVLLLAGTLWAAVTAVTGVLSVLLVLARPSGPADVADGADEL